jgi:hypothetical protein
MLGMKTVHSSITADCHEYRAFNPRCQEFIHILEADNVKRLVDVRTVPRSRPLPVLGGFRHACRDPVNTVWHSANLPGAVIAR